MRIVIVDHHLLFADALALALEHEGYVATAVPFDHADGSMATVLAHALRSAGRLVLIEHDLGELGDGLRLIPPLTASGACVVLITESRDPAHWGEAVRLGAATVLHKSCSLGRLVETVGRVCHGLPLMSPAQRARLIAAARGRRAEDSATRSRLDRLTPGETSVLEALMRGEQAREIARTRVVVESTVRAQIKSILAKLDVTSQIGAVGAAYRVGWRADRCPKPRAGRVS